MTSVKMRESGRLKQGNVPKGISLGIPCEEKSLSPKLTQLGLGFGESVDEDALR